MPIPPQPQTQLVLFRKRMGFSRKYVATLLGHRDASMLSRYESGLSKPTLVGALQLEIVYRAPVAFLFPGLYEELREEIRSKEERLSGRGQLELELFSSTEEARR